MCVCERERGRQRDSENVSNIETDRDVGKRWYEGCVTPFGRGVDGGGPKKIIIARTLESLFDSGIGYQ